MQSLLFGCENYYSNDFFCGKTERKDSATVRSYLWHGHGPCYFIHTLGTWACNYYLSSQLRELPALWRISSACPIAPASSASVSIRGFRSLGPKTRPPPHPWSPRSGERCNSLLSHELHETGLLPDWGWATVIDSATWLINHSTSGTVSRNWKLKT